MKTKWKVMAALLGAAGMANAAYVTIGDPGNDPDGPGGYGAVGYTYKISATEVTIAEFAASGAGSGNENYWDDVGQGTSVGPSAPAVNVTLYEAMKYCNYLTSGNVNNGAYVFSGGSYQSTDRASAISTYGTIYALPTEDEWYKAAYYTGDSGDLWSLYADGTDTVPTEGGGATGWNYNNVNSSPNYTRDTAHGTVEQNGTVNMMGNVWEWMEDSAGVIRGGGYFNNEAGLRSSERNIFPSSIEISYVGFRPVEVVPEPATMGLIALASGFALLFRRRFTA